MPSQRWRLYFWLPPRGADSKPYFYDVIRPYLTSFISGEYSDAGFLHLRRICEAHVKEHSEESLSNNCGRSRESGGVYSGGPGFQGMEYL